MNRLKTAAAHLIPALVPLVIVLSGCSRGGGAAPGGDGDIIVTPNPACVVIGEKRRFTSSANGVAWSVESSVAGVAIGTVDSHGWFTAGHTPVTGKIVAKRGTSSGYAGVIVVASKAGCLPVLATASANIWKATFDLKMTFPSTNGAEYLGDLIYNAHLMFCFTTSDDVLTIAAPGGSAHLDVSDTVAPCNAHALGSTDFQVVSIKGTWKDNHFIFGKGFVALDHNEGEGISCEAGYAAASWEDKNASAINRMTSSSAFPLTMEAKDGATVQISGTLPSPGRPSTVIGSAVVKQGCP